MERHRKKKKVFFYEKELPDVLIIVFCNLKVVYYAKIRITVKTCTRNIGKSIFLTTGKVLDTYSYTFRETATN